MGSYPIQIGLHEKQNKTKIEIIKKKNKINDKNVNSKGRETCNIAQAAVNLSIHSLIRTINL